jgi:CDP-diacylglycerol pyrophosphatase
METVNFKIWIPPQYENVEGKQYSNKVPGTGKWTDDFTEIGLFHQWGLAIEEAENSVGSYTVAIVEKADGTMVVVLPSNIKFLNPHK